MKVNISKKKEARTKLELEQRDVIDALRKVGYNVPDNAVVKFHVPGGGDWSNMDLDICEDTPLLISWTDTEYENEE